MTLLRCVAAICFVACFAACGLLSPEQQQTALQAIDQMRANGSITQAQYEALREGILSSGQGAWWQQLAMTVGGAAAAYFGIQLRRGPVATMAEKVIRKSEIVTPDQAVALNTISQPTIAVSTKPANPMA
jgi:hypothetical protein